MLDRLKSAVRKLWRYRSSITGKWVSKAFADANPDTTQREKGK